uniref:Ribosomal protein L11 methyltransferase n=1 Tax=Magnetococcus massalia (strain MO-1) TaxID=451514 RepID=A0A1S7LEJ0_MAGMO|nr:putative ribosomal protein L11 methyltransferase [Candidatus Magnetococcus massalia]
MMWSLSFELPVSLSEAVSQWLLDEGSMGASIEDTGSVPVLDESGTFERCQLRGYFDDRPHETDFALRLQLFLTALGHTETPTLTWQEREEEDWQEAWKQYFEPIEVGENLLILPSWLEPPAENQRTILSIDPQQAFGTGSHATTFGCLERIEHYIKSRGCPTEMMDLGTGSGILAIAARKLGTPQVLATDIDPVAVETCQENARLNGVSEGLTAQLAETVPTDQQMPLITANILMPVLVSMLQNGLANALAPGGTLLLSGILAEQSDEIRSAIDAAGLQLVEPIHHYEEWVVMEACKNV